MDEYSWQEVPHPIQQKFKICLAQLKWEEKTFAKFFAPYLVCHHFLVYLHNLFSRNPFIIDKKLSKCTTPYHS